MLVGLVISCSFQNAHMKCMIYIGKCLEGELWRYLTHMCVLEGDVQEHTIAIINHSN
jgi:hypothetical protein